MLQPNDSRAPMPMSNPPIAAPPASVRTFFTLGLTTSDPRVTCPSAMTQTESPLRTQRTVVARAWEVEKGEEEERGAEVDVVEAVEERERGGREERFC